MTPVTLSEAKSLKGEKTMLEEKDLSMDKIADQLMEWVNEEQNIVKICDEVSFDLIADTEKLETEIAKL